MTARPLVAGIVLLSGIFFLFSDSARLDADYLVLVARHRPSFGIAGTDPVSLQKHAQSLGATQNALMYAQADMTSTLAIRALYPIRFLNALAQLEASRLRLLAEPDERRARAYARELVRTSYFGRKDAAAHHAALLTIATHLKAVKTPIITLAGASSAEHMIALSSLTASRMIEVQEQIHSDITCARSRSCAPPAKPLLQIPGGSDPQRTPTMELVEKFYEAEVPDGKKEHFVLDSSACLATLDAPYYLLMRTTPEAGERLHALNDLFFFPTAGSKGEILTFLTERDVRYVAHRALNFYICPYVQYEHGLVYALQEALKHLPEAALRELDGALSERLLRTRLMLENTDEISEDAREELLLMLSEKSAGLDRLVERISIVLGTHLSQQQNGVPFDMSAADLFITHNALPSLFLLHNPHAGTPLVPRPISAEEQGAVAAFYAKEFKNLDSLLTDMTWDELVGDIRAVRSIDSE